MLNLLRNLLNIWEEMCSNHYMLEEFSLGTWMQGMTLFSEMITNKVLHAFQEPQVATD